MKFNQIAVAFLIGLLIGALAGPFIIRHGFHRNWNRDYRRTHLLKKISSRLNLSPDQEAYVAKIFDANRPKVDAIFTEMRTQLDAVRKETGDEIKKQLSPEQQKKYDDLDAEMQARMKRHFPPPPSSIDKP